MKKAFIYSFKSSIPVLVSFIPLGIAYGILMQTSGYNWLWSGLASLFVFAGSLQFLMISFMSGVVSLATVALMALLLNSRHIFYGIPFIEKWKDYKAWRCFLIFALPDESFSLHVANTFDDGNPRHKKFSYIFTAALVYFYWVSMSIVGAVAGEFITFDTTGIDFAMTALFIVILIEQIKKASSKLPIIIAFASAIISLLLLGPSNFILPSLVVTVGLLYAFKKYIDRNCEAESDANACTELNSELNQESNEKMSSESNIMSSDSMNKDSSTNKNPQFNEELNSESNITTNSDSSTNINPQFNEELSSESNITTNLDPSLNISIESNADLTYSDFSVDEFKSVTVHSDNRYNEEVQK